MQPSKADQCALQIDDRRRMHGSMAAVFIGVVVLRLVIACDTFTSFPSDIGVNLCMNVMTVRGS